MLQFVVHHGNVTVYEWSYGEPPLTVEPDPVHIELDDDDLGKGDKVLCQNLWQHHLKAVLMLLQCSWRRTGQGLQQLYVKLNLLA